MMAATSAPPTSGSDRTSSGFKLELGMFSCFVAETNKQMTFTNRHHFSVICVKVNKYKYITVRPTDSLT